MDDINLCHGYLKELANGCVEFMSLECERVKLLDRSLPAESSAING